jgi:hypothetical protein
MSNFACDGDRAVANFKHALAQARTEWWEEALAPGRTDRGLAEASLAALYAARGRAMPAVQWCGSPLALVRAAAECGGGDDVAGELLYRPYRRELAAVAGRTTKRYRIRSHLLAELQDLRARRIAESFWDAVFDALKAGGELHVWDATRGSVWDYFEYDDIDVRETVQPELLGALAPSRFVEAHWGFPGRGPAVCDLVHSCGGFVLRERLALLGERHELLAQDDDGRLHRVDGPAAAWPDGFAIHAWHGARVPREVIEDPDALDPRAVVVEPNVEVRRVMIERLGHERLIRGLALEPIAEDETGRLWRVEQPPDEPLVLVEVENATLERDGTRKSYFLRVPPDLQTARDAVAWTFDTTPDAYGPLVET